MGELTYIKHMGCSSEILKEPLTGTKILFCGRGTKFFAPLRSTDSKTACYLLYVSFRSTPFEGTAKAWTALG